MRSFCSFSDNSLVQSFNLYDHLRSYDDSIQWALPVPIIWKILSYLEMPPDIIEQEDHYCSPDHPCRKIITTVIRPFLQLGHVCHSFKLMSRDLYSRRRRGETWTDTQPDPYHLKSIVRWKHIDGRYRHLMSLQDYRDDEGCSLAYDTGTSVGCHRDLMPLVVVKVLSGYRYETPAELAAYSAIESDDATVDVSAFASMLSHGQFEYEWNTIDYFVLDYLGPTLLDVMQRSCYSRFTGKMTMAVAIQLLRRHRDTHSVHLIHNGAKPANYCLPPNPGTVDDDIVNTKIYMIDFGFSTFFTPPSEGGSPYDVCGFSGGNPCFRSTGCDAGDSVSPRDDLEGLAYTLAYLGKGSLPWWRGPNGHWYSEEYRCKYDEKADAGVNVIFGGMDPIYTWFFELVKGMSWGEMPDYDALIQKFCERWIEKGYGSTPGEYEWWIKSTKKENFSFPGQLRNMTNMNHHCQSQPESSYPVRTMKNCSSSNQNGKPCQNRMKMNFFSLGEEWIQSIFLFRTFRRRKQSSFTVHCLMPVSAQ
ncbi:hypothetical protein SISSUDRAFT_436649 [Sistotremastrum suecicum HHB10207 ss-3]|uniref:Protein kinase domain-containing protein n=1 Tax=Sistotremastrum suecicum HHB10207 ss-3 TaxID=1314776 RepID=A0A166FIK0_9AGAM|nr:hypothetical protein SISSUDRAFT_436649 [Sistotremastrum suecicum HHB10207 ss-3]